MEVWFLIVCENFILFSIVAAPIYIPSNSSQASPSPTQPCQHLFLLFLILTIEPAVKWYLFLVLICISLMTSDAEHLLMYLLAICVSSLQDCLYRSSAHLLIELFFLCVCFFYYWVVWVIYIFLILTLHQIYDMQIFVPFTVGFLYILLMIFFSLQKSFS